MRTLGEIIECMKDGEEATQEELYYSVLALEALSSFDGMDIRRLAEKESKIYTPERVYGESYILVETCIIDLFTKKPIWRINGP